jgi:hypothetical protein
LASQSTSGPWSPVEISSRQLRGARQNVVNSPSKRAASASTAMVCG